MRMLLSLSLSNSFSSLLCNSSLSLYSSLSHSLFTGGCWVMAMMMIFDASHGKGANEEHAETVSVSVCVTHQSKRQEKKRRGKRREEVDNPFNVFSNSQLC